MINIKINHPKYDYPVEVSKESYITAKWKDLQEFGMFMKDDIVIPAPAESETTK